jgi:hypothetical protein
MARNHAIKYLATLALAASLPVFAFGANPHSSKPQPTPTPTPTTSPAIEMSSTVIDNGGFPNATGLDVLGQPCTAYFAGRELKFADFNGATWVIQSVGFVGGDYGASSMDMAVDASGHPTVVFSVPWENGANSNHLYVASSDGTSWAVQSLALFSWAPSITIGPDGRKYIVYVTSGMSGSILKMAEGIGSSWTTSTVDDSNVTAGVRNVYNPSVAVDGLGNVAASYGYYIQGVTKQVRYAYRSAGVWQTKPVFYDIGLSTDLAFDAANRPIVAFWAAGGGLHMMYSDGAANWSNYLLPWSGGIVGQISLLLGTSGTAYLSAFDGGAGDLRLISGSPGNYVNKLVASTGTVGKSNSSVINKSTGQKCVSFSDESAGALKVAGF